MKLDSTVSAVVTGGASGIGRCIVRALLGRGASVVIADVEEPVLEATVEELSALGPVSGVRTDVTDEASTTALADAVWAAWRHHDTIQASGQKAWDLEALRGFG